VSQNSSEILEFILPPPAVAVSSQTPAIPPPPFAEPPFAEPPFAEPPFAEPPLSKPPITEPPLTKTPLKDDTGGNPSELGPAGFLSFFHLKETPSWLISMMVHVAIILLLALIPLSEKIRSSMSLIIAIGETPELGEQLTEFEMSSSQLEVDTDESTLTTSEVVVENVTLRETLPAALSIDKSLPVSISKGLSGRSGATKGALLKAYGGTEGTENAVAEGLKWLAKNQRSDGSWSLVGPFGDGAVTENKPAATAMALLAFMGAGNTHRSGEYKDRVARGFDYLRKLQGRDGFFADQAAGNQRTYAQAQCTIAICELYGMTNDEQLRPIAQLAVRYAEKAQNKGGGWRYQPRENGDTSVTGWYVMALISARMAGLDVDSEVLERVNRFLNTVQRMGMTNQPSLEGERYAYQPYAKPTMAMTAEGMMCRLYLGWDTQDPRISEGAELLCNNPISTDEDRISFYYWYYATTTLHHIGGKYWSIWNESMKEVLPKHQVQQGRETGSWPPDGDLHADGGGRLYATCFAIYCLESYYRHLPLSEMAPK